MAEPFLTFDDTRMRLDQTYCEYKGKPVFVQATGHNQLIAYSVYQRDGEGVRVDVEDKDFSYTSLQLGYVEWNGEVYYLSRAPARQQHAGIHRSQIDSDPFMRSGIQHNHLATKEFENCLTGSHRKADRAVQILEDNPDTNGAVIHRHFALKKLDNYQIGMFFRSRFVAFHVGELRFIILPHLNDKSFVRKAIERNKLGVSLYENF